MLAPSLVLLSSVLIEAVRLRTPDALDLPHDSTAVLPNDRSTTASFLNTTGQFLNDPLRPHPPHKVEFPIHDAIPGQGVERAWMTFTRSEHESHDLMAYDLLIPLSGAMARCYLRRNSPNPDYPLVGKEGFKYESEKVIYALNDVDPKKPAWMTWQMIYAVTFNVVRYTHRYAALDTVIELVQADKSADKGEMVMARGFLKNIPVK